MELKQLERERFSKQEALPFFGKEGMQKLKDTTVLIVGLGGGGCAASHQLALTNVGKLILCDFDIVGNSNLGRQFLHKEATLGIDKVISAKIALKNANPFLEVETISQPISKTILQKVKEENENLAIFVAVDKFHAHYLINDFCIENKIPAIHIAQFGYKGFIYTYDPKQSKTCIDCAIRQNFNKEIDSSGFDKGEAGLPYFAPAISIVCSIGIIELLKIKLKLDEKSMSNIFCIYRAVEHEDMFETKQSGKPFFDEIPIYPSANCQKCKNII